MENNENKELLEVLKAEGRKVIEGIKNSNQYKSFFGPIEGESEITTRTTRSRTVLPSGLLVDLQVLNGDNVQEALNELVSLMGEQLCAEAYMLARREEVKECKKFEAFENMEKFVESIPTHPYDVIVLPAEIASFVCNKEDFIPYRVDKRFFLGIEEIGTFKNKIITVDPNLPAHVVTNMNYGGIDFDLSVENSELQDHWSMPYLSINFEITVRNRQEYLKTIFVKGVTEYYITPSLTHSQIKDLNETDI